MEFHMLFRRLIIVSTFVCSACGSDPFSNVGGTVDGHTVSSQSFYWGGPFLVMTDVAQTCKDMYWVQQGSWYIDGDEAPTDTDLVALQFSFNESDLTAGTYSVEGQAPVYAHVIVTNNSTMTVYRADSGTLTIDEITDNDRVLGSVNLMFDEEAVTGDFDVEWCNNIKG